ncbi:putative ribonuclease H-like domain-containing protein [Tanacetum coccineum]
MASCHVSFDPVPQCPTTALEQDSLSLGPQSQENVPQAAETVTTSNELDFLFSTMFDELLNGTTPVVSKSSAVTAADAPDKRQLHNTTPSTSTTVAADTPLLNIQTTPETTSQAPTQAPTITATENINQAETQKENEQVDEDEFINIFSTPVHEQGETSIISIEFHSLIDIRGRELVDRPLYKNVINMKWLWKKKRDEKNTVIRNKARLVAKGYNEQEGINFEELFAAVARLKRRERKARTTLLMALREDHLAKFHKMTDAKVSGMPSNLDLGIDRIKEVQKHRGLKKVEAQLVAHQQGQLWYEQKIKFMKIDLDDKTDVLTYHKKLLAEAQKEKDDLKAKVEKWHHSSKNLGKLLNSQMSAYDKFGLGYGDHRYNGILSYENEVLQSVFKGKESDFENPPLNDRLVKTGEMHAVPPPMTGNYMPSGPDIEIDYSQFTYGPKQTQPSESESQTSEFDTCESNISTEPSELVSEPVVNESNVECQPKVWSDAPIIEEYESDSEDEYVSIPTKEHETPSFANQQVKTPRENVKNQSTHSQKPKVNKKELGYGFTVRACFVCGSLNHLIRDCDFHEKRMARKAELNNGWNNVQRVNKQNQFVPSAVLTRTGKIPVSTARARGTKNFRTARQSFNRQTVLTSTAMKVNTVKPIVNGVRPANVFHKTHSPSSRPFKRTTVLRTNFSNQKVYTAKVKEVSTVGEKWDTADNPHRTLKNKGIIDSGCSRHMTGNKAYLADFQDFNGGPVAFGAFQSLSVSQMCDKKNKVLFTDSECLVLSPDFKLPDENQILLKVPRQNNMYSFNLENIVPLGGLACLIAKATTDESNKWHRRLGHVNFKNLNRLVKGNLVRGLPTKLFQNDHTCVACQKGKQHKASCKAKVVSSISQTLQLLHMDLFGPTSVRSINHKTYCLVITDDFSRFSWTFFLRTKDETSAILKDFIRQIENQLNQKVKTIRCDNGTEFKNRDVIEFCGLKGIKREYSNARTPQQNGVC